ncbi:MAG: RNA-binding S4 domain-containing protein [Syntrophomonadaceae bacterium]|jgi:ribosome-associated protein|nr:RNA-binding S4 domain-containing protein [Syntrophomonadaceae bacterium]
MITVQKKVSIKTEQIDLDQFLKWAEIVGSGGEAKYLIKEGLVLVNGAIEKRRSRSLFRGDIVEITNSSQIKIQII